MTPKRGLNEKLLQFCGKFSRVPVYYLDIPGSTRNIAQYTGKHVSLRNQLCYRVPLLVSLYQLPFERNSMRMQRQQHNCYRPVTCVAANRRTEQW